MCYLVKPVSPPHPLLRPPPSSAVRPGQPAPQEEEEDGLGGEGEEMGGAPLGASAAGAAKGGKGAADKAGREALLLGARQPSVQRTSERPVLWGVSEQQRCDHHTVM